MRVTEQIDAMEASAVNPYKFLASTRVLACILMLPLLTLAAEGAADNMKSISAKINQGQGTVGALINDKSIYRQASAGAAAFNDDMEALKHNFLLRGFFKKRGYEDSDELTKYAVAKLPAEPSSKTFTFDAAQIFDKPDTAKLKNKKSLDEAGNFLAHNKFGLAVVTARGGLTGDTDKIRQSTDAQAMAAREYLVDNFRIDDTRVKIDGLGKAQDPNESHELEVLVYPAGNAPVAEKVFGAPTPSRSRLGK
jgi:hypothetical protein